MFCDKCRVKLAPSEKQCPLCKTKFNNINSKIEILSYPSNIEKFTKKNNWFYLILTIILTLLIFAINFDCF